MRLPRPRFTVRRMMVTVAIAGVLMGYAVHARNVLHQEGDFGYAILVTECIGMLVLSASFLPIVFTVYLVRQEYAYAARIRRNDAPVDPAPVIVDDGSPRSESS